MTHSKPITITALVIALFAGISFSDASQALIKHGVKGKHKHAAHKLAVKHSKATSQTLAKSEAGKEYGCVPPNDSLWFLQLEDPATGTIPTGLYTTWYNSDHAMTYSGRDGMLSNTGISPLDTVACLGPFYNDGTSGVGVGGRTRALLVSSASDNILFAGAATGGLWKSTNAGSHWTPVNDTAACLNVSCIIQSPFNSNVIYYGTGEGANVGGGIGAFGAGVFKSTNGGTTFQQLSATTNMGQSWAIGYDKTDSLTVYYGTIYHGLQRTTDGGATWSMAPGTTGSICDIITYPSGKVIIAKTDSGLYAATNGKTGSFTKISSMAFPNSGTFHQIKLANCKNFPNVVYAEFDTTIWYYESSGFCKSSDGGVTWTARTKPWLGSLGGYALILGVDPLDSNIIVSNGWFSTNGGGTWSQGGGGYADPHALVSLSGSHAFLRGDDGGVEHCNWDTLLLQFGAGSYYLDNNYVTTQFYGGDFANSGRRCAGGTQDRGSWRLRPSDGSWLVEGGDGGFAHISQQDSTAYVEDQFAVYRESNFWTTLYPIVTIAPTAAQSAEGVNWLNLYGGNYGDGTQLYFLTFQGMWRTTDMGDNWTRLNTTAITGIWKVGCTNAANPTVYFDGHTTSPTRGHFYRIDNAKTFTPGTPVDLSASLPDTTSYMGEISPYPPNPSTLFVGIISWGSGPRAYKVMNANTAKPTWVNITGNLPPYISINQIQADPDDTTSLLAATSFGLYFSGDMGAHWYKDYRVPNVSINQMPLRAYDRKLFLFTYGRGVWYCSLLLPSSKRTTTASSAGTTDGIQFSMYPNPATEKLTVNPQQELSSTARITIYSSDGRMISESAWNPTDGQKQEVNIGSLPSGIYFLQITDGNRIAKNKFVKM